MHLPPVKAGHLAGHKCTSYLARLLGMREAQQRGVRKPCGSTQKTTWPKGRSATSLWSAKVLSRRRRWTPRCYRESLAAWCWSWCGSLGVGFADMPLSVDDLLDADEVFLTNSIMQVLPVVRVERHDIRDAKVGPITRQLQAAYRQLVEAECKRS